MTDSHYSYVHWRDMDLINVDTEWESEDLPHDDIMVPFSLQPVSAEEGEQALFEQQMIELEQKWTENDLPSVEDTVEMLPAEEMP